MVLLYLLLEFPAFTVIRSRRLNAAVMKRTSGRSQGTFKQIMSWIFRQDSVSTFFAFQFCFVMTVKQWIRLSVTGKQNFACHFVDCFEVHLSLPR